MSQRARVLLVLIAVLVVAGAGSARAYGLSLVATSPTENRIGDLVSYDVIFDIPVNDGLILFSAGVTFRSDAAVYRPDLSVSNDYYPLYAPAAGKSPANWLNPNVGFGPDLYTPDGPGFDTWPAPPPGRTQINIDFLNPTFQPTTGTATGLWLGTLVFEVVAPGGPAELTLGFDTGGNIFNVNGSDASASVGLWVSSDFGTLTPIPEPAGALLVGLGLVALALRRAKRIR